MLELIRPLGGAVLVCCVIACGTEAQQQKSQASKTNPDAIVLKDFNDRIEAYTKLRNKLKDDVPPLKETKDPAKIKASQEALAAKIREARKTARPGEIFTPEIRTKFRQLMYPETTGTAGRETKETIKDDAPAAGEVKFKVNASYPEDEPLPTMPPNLLASLPRLPEDLEYRIISKHLILRDVHTNLIVDYIPNAIR